MKIQENPVTEALEGGVPLPRWMEGGHPLSEMEGRLGGRERGNVWDLGGKLEGEGFLLGVCIP